MIYSLGGSLNSTRLEVKEIHIQANYLVSAHISLSYSNRNQSTKEMNEDEVVDRLPLTDVTDLDKMNCELLTICILIRFGTI